MNTTVPNMIMDLTPCVVAKKRCRVCVDKIMDKLTKSVVTEDKKLPKKL